MVVRLPSVGGGDVLGGSVGVGKGGADVGNVVVNGLMEVFEYESCV